MKDKSKIILILLLVIVFSFISWIYSWLNFIIFLAFYSLFFYTISFPFKRYKDKNFKFFDLENLGKFSLRFAHRISIILLVVFIISWSFAYYQNKISPAMMPTYTLTNWKQTIIFQAMSHIASSEFYNEVKSSLEMAKKDWYILYYEWVRPWTKDSSEKFDKALWVKFDKNLYENMSKLYWLVHQDNSIYVYSWAVNMDLSMDDLVQIYDKFPSESKNTARPIDINPIIDTTLNTLNPKELEILRFFNKAIINTIIKNGELQDAMAEGLWSKALMDTILWERNKYIVKTLESSKDKKIFVTYWLLHFKWVFTELQKKDKNWKIEKTEYLQVVR